MNTTNSTTNIELVILEDLFNQECSCESRCHPLKPCSTHVTHLSINCDGKRKVCEAAAEYALTCIESERDFCSKCELPCSVCWSIIPI